MLDALHVYCNEWKLEVNVQKNKIVIFNYLIIVVFNYLGVLMSSNGNIFKTQEPVAGHAGKKSNFFLFEKFKKTLF